MKILPRFDCRNDVPPGECPMVQNDAKGHFALAWDVELVRAALVRMVGVDGVRDLEQMKATIQGMPCPQEDMMNIVHACNALLDTLPPDMQQPLDFTEGRAS